MLFGRTKKKKRLQYDPPGSRSRKKANRAANRRDDEIFLTRRVFLLKGAVASAFTVLVARLGYMQIGRGSTYDEAASGNITAWSALKPARGLIVDRRGRTLASNRKSWAAGIIPVDVRQLDEDKLAYVREQLMTALRLPSVVMINPGAIPKEAKEQVYRRVGRLLGDSTEQDFEDTQNWIALQLKVNDYAKFDGITADQEAQFNGHRSELPGVEVVNLFDFVIRNFRYTSTPVTLKRDISREVAMKLASNQLYLPGVVLDDDVLARKYDSGPTMSHILGFAGPITFEELTHESNVISRDENDVYQFRYYQHEDIIGKQGLELYYEEQLRGSKGGYLYERDGDGREVRRLTEGATAAVPGRNLRLTIDLELQAAVSRVLEQELPIAMQRRHDADAKNNVPYSDHQTRGGAIVILDVKSGEVLAMASHPTYDNTLFVEGISQRKYDELDDDAGGPLYDKCYMQKYPPGSVIKPFMALTGLREGVIDSARQFTCEGGIRVPLDFDESKGNNYRCWKTDGHKVMTVESAVQQSCDVFFYNVGVPAGERRDDGTINHYQDYSPISQSIGSDHDFAGLGMETIHTNLTKKFWFNRITGIDLPSETPGLIGNDAYKREVFNQEGWSIGDTINASIGQGFVETSPLQIAVNTAAICNGGKVMKPLIVQSVVDGDGVVLQRFEPVVKRRLKLDSDHISLVLGGMHKVIHDPMGTAYGTEDNRKFQFTNPLDGTEPIQIGGKTGTAEFLKVDRDSGIKVTDPVTGSDVYDAHAWFTMFAPFDDPEVAITVFIESGGEGSTNAVPVADKAFRAYLESTGARPRGKVLREDGQPVSDTVASPLDDPDAGRVGEGTPVAEPAGD